MKPSELDPERWRRIDQVLEAALETPPAERAAYVERACGDDADLRAEVEALLEAHARAGGRFDRPASPDVASLVESLEASAGSLPEDRRVGPFRLLREIGRGGMGVVYLAEDTRLGRHVALKALPPWLGVGEEARHRFVSEARAVSTLDHPNIATLYETDTTDDGQLYMVFAYYEGETLADRISRGPLSPEEAVAIARGIASGLQAAHDKGIVHRDVKPSNVLLSDTGDVKLLDFGVAKVAGEEATRSGLRLGTVAYMSPEQASGGSVDERADLWSLGVVSYEMVTGERPFRGDEPSSLIRSILHDDPEPPGTKCAGLPAALDTVIQTLLCKDADGRYASAGELVSDLDAVRSEEAPPAAILRTSTRKGQPAGRSTRPPPRQLRKWRLPAALIGLAVLSAGAWLIAARSGGVGGGGRVGRLAVLPLENRTGDPGQQYFVDGIHDALISELGKIGTFDVMSRTSVQRFREATMTVPEIAAALDVDAVVEGSVLRDADSIAVTAALVRASPERQLWSDSYRRAVGGVYGVASDVARSIALAIGVEITPEDSASLAARQEVNPEAYDAYLLGKFHLERRDREGFEQARRYLFQAIEIDSTFAPAYTTLAEAYGSATFFGMFRPSEAMPRVRALGERALRLDSTLSEAHWVVAAVKLYYDWDWDGAERGVRRALELNPSNGEGYGILSEVLSIRGRYDEALRVIEKGSELRRFVPFAAFRPSVVLLYMREFDRAIERIREGLEFFPEFWQGYWLLCRALAAKGEYEEALVACARAVEDSGRNPMPIGSLGYVHALAGGREEAQAVIAELKMRRDLGYVPASRIAIVYGALQDLDAAFDWLDRAYEERDVTLVHLDEHSLFDPLRADPRFEGLRRRIGLPE